VLVSYRQLNEISRFDNSERRREKGKGERKKLRMGEVGAGVRLVAAHLAKVKLAAAENEHAARQHEAALSRELAEVRRKLVAAEGELRELRAASGYKALVIERDKWKSLVDSLRADKSELLARIEALDASSRGSVNGNDSDLISSTTPLEPQSETHPTRNEVVALRHALRAKEMEADALRKKLDRELELKFEREHKARQSSAGWHRTLLDSFVEALNGEDEDEEEEDDEIIRHVRPARGSGFNDQNVNMAAEEGKSDLVESESF